MLETCHSTNLAGAPTAYRLLLAAGEEATRPIKGQLRVADSASEPLTPEVMSWIQQHVGCSVYVPRDPLAARRQLLHGPAVAVRIAEEDERAPGELPDLADLDPPRDELGTRGMDV